MDCPPFPRQSSEYSVRCSVKGIPSVTLENNVVIRCGCDSCTAYQMILSYNLAKKILGVSKRTSALSRLTHIFHLLKKFSSTYTFTGSNSHFAIHWLLLMTEKCCNQPSKAALKIYKMFTSSEYSKEYVNSCIPNLQRQASRKPAELRLVLETTTTGLQGNYIEIPQMRAETLYSMN